ncbi:sensor histidine kinase [Cohnella suwonensis]|uniref:Sensor histidine kinase n=1 Tax=Cohnella suwonensis TaxID=696072 RepID=A0ABW0M2C6_9BACL
MKGLGLGVQRNMFLIFSLLTLILIVASFSFFYSYLANRLKNDAKANMEQLTTSMSERIDLFYGELNHITFQIINSPDLLEIMEQADESDNLDNYFGWNTQIGRKANNYLATIKGPNNHVSRIRLYNNHGDYTSLGMAPENMDAIRSHLQSRSYQEFYQRIIENDNIHFVGPHADPFAENEPGQVVSFYRVFRNYLETFGIIEIQLTVPEFAATLGITDNADLKAYIFDKDGQPAYQKTGNGPQEEITLDRLLDHFVADNEKSVNLSENVITYRQSVASQWHIFLAEPKSVLLAPVKVVGRLIVIVSFAFILLSLIMIYMISKQLTKRMRKTVDLIREVSLDNLSLKLDPSVDEIHLINKAITGMFERLKASMEKEVQAHSRELRARINALESQMDPHFLYNVLSVIGSVGEDAGVPKVMELCEKLGAMFRYTSQHQDKEVTVHDELTYARLYLDLMKVRFEDHFQYQVEIDESSLSSKVPRLIFQPLIENCFRHAFRKPAPPWIIHLALKQTADHHWLFEVKDWGDGFDPAALDKFQRRIESYDRYNAKDKRNVQEFSGNEGGGGVGLFNIFMRLRLTYEERAFHEIVTNRPNGTIVRIGVKRTNIEAR